MYTISRGVPRRRYARSDSVHVNGFESRPNGIEFVPGTVKQSLVFVEIQLPMYILTFHFFSPRITSKKQHILHPRPRPLKTITHLGRRNVSSFDSRLRVGT